MTPERFEQLAEAWGAELRRWPAQEQAAARALLAHPSSAAAARAALARAAELDALLDAYAVAPPDAALASAVLAGAGKLPAYRPARRGGAGRTSNGTRDSARGRWSWHWWLPGAGIAGVGLAGAAAGALAVALLIGTALPRAQPAMPEAGWWPATAFDASGAFAQGSEE